MQEIDSNLRETYVSVKEPYLLFNIFDNDLLCFRTLCYFCQQHLPGRKLFMAKVTNILNIVCDANFIHRSSPTS